jgi:intein-encoded DNA endonuclease-like protein
MFRRVLQLRQQSYLYREIIEEIQDQFGVRLAKETISDWVRGVSSPLNSGHLFDPKPTPELAYVIGVETGDAFLNEKRNNYQYRIRLRAVDVEFVEAFNQAVARVRGCSPHKLWKGKNIRETEVEFGSYLLHKFLSQPLDELKPYIEHSAESVAAFLRGFFDSEGCIDTRRNLSASNSDLRLLNYVQHLLLTYFGIETTSPRIGTKKGSVITRRGKSYRRNAPVYVIQLRGRYLKAFCDKIGFTIRRKRSRLERAMKGLDLPRYDSP